MASTTLVNIPATLQNVADGSISGISTISAAIALTTADSGRFFRVSKAGGYTITLPALVPGLQFTFLSGAVAANTVTITAGAAIMTGLWRQISGVATVTAASTSIAFTATSVISDRVDLVCDGTNWYCNASTGVAAGLLFA